MKGGLEKTFDWLATTSNESATSLLLAKLDDPRREVQTAALQALVRRRSPSGHRELLRRWDSLSERFKSTIAEQSSRVAGAVRDALLSSEPALADNGLDAVLRLREYDLIPTLLNAAEDKSDQRGAKAARAVLALADMLYEEIANQSRQGSRRDPQRTRQFLITSLEKAASRYDHHQHSEILEAFLLLAGSTNTTLRRFLQNPHSKFYLPTVTLLAQSSRPGIQRLLLSFLSDQHCPTTIHSILSKRQDVAFLRRFFRLAYRDLNKTRQINLRRIESFSWLQEDLKLLNALSEEEQQGAVRLIAASGVNRLQAFEVIRYLLLHGTTGARRAASAALREFHGADANQLVVRCLEDADAEVRANVVRQLRDRGIPNAMQRLLEMVLSPEPAIAAAARESLQEFSFERFLSSFDLLSEEAARNTGQLVSKIDLQSVAKLIHEFQSKSRTRRLRALNVAVAMEVVPELEKQVVELLADEDHFTRAEAARVARYCDSPAIRQALRELLLDRSASVQEAAERTLQSFARSATEPAAPAPPLDLPAATSQFGKELLP